MTQPDRSPPGDELTQRYREASAQETRRPGAHVRDAVRAHAQMVIAASKAPTATDNTPKVPAANQSRWKISALAGLALAGLTGLLVLQFDRGTDEEKDIAFGQPSASAPPAPAPATAPVTVAPPTPQADSRNAGSIKSADSAPEARKAPAKPAAEKPAPQPSATGAIAPKTEAEAAAPSFKSAAPSPAAPPLPAPAPAAPPAPAAQENAPLARTAPLADAATGGQAAVSATPPQAPVPAAAQPPAPVAAPAPAMAAPAPAVPAAAVAAPEQKRERLSAPTPSLRAEASGAPRLAGALQNAARAGNLPQVERLLRQGAALNAADAAGRTPLILAAMQGHTAVVQRLLAAGANPALIDNDGLNAQQHARRLGFDGIAHLIEAAR